MNRAKHRRKPKPEIQREDVTPERAQHNGFVSAGMAYRVVPVIETLHNRWIIEERDGVPIESRKGISITEWVALEYYREQAHRAQDDEAHAGTLAPERIMGCSAPMFASGIPPRLCVTPAILETARLENFMGELRDIARAVAVDDMSLTQWAIKRSGGREKYEGGRITGIVPREKSAVRIAGLELRMAAHRIVLCA